MEAKSRYANSLFICLIINFYLFAAQCDTTKTLLGEEKIICAHADCPTDSTVEISINGILRRKYTYHTCKDSGVFLYFSEKGDTLTRSYFVDDKTVGLLKQWHSNGRLKTIAHYDNEGRKHGLSQTWREDGTRKDSTVFKNDTIVETRQYFNSGMLRYWSKDCRDDYRRDAVFFAPDGTISGEITGGNGTYVLYAEDGKTRYFREYKDGKEISSRKLLMEDKAQ
jgi:antitoxin component YwqK of YwqJK toxin-antitoxin module